MRTRLWATLVVSSMDIDMCPRGTYRRFKALASPRSRTRQSGRSARWPAGHRVSSRHSEQESCWAGPWPQEPSQSPGRTSGSKLRLRLSDVGLEGIPLRQSRPRACGRPLSRRDGSELQSLGSGSRRAIALVQQGQVRGPISPPQGLRSEQDLRRHASLRVEGNRGFLRQRSGRWLRAQRVGGSEQGASGSQPRDLSEGAGSVRRDETRGTRQRSPEAVADANGL